MTLLETFSDGLPVPKLLVFDLDYTLWPFWVDTHVRPPVKAQVARHEGQGEEGVVDRCNESFSFYPSVPELLLALKSLPNPPILAIASRSSAPGLATTILKLLQLPSPHSSSHSAPESSWSTSSSGAAAASVSAQADSPSDASTAPDQNSSPPSPSKKSALQFFDHVEIFPGDKKRHFANIRKASGVPYEEMVFFDDEARNRNVEVLGVVMLLVKNGVSALEVDEGVRGWRRRRKGIE